MRKLVLTLTAVLLGLAGLLAFAKNDPELNRQAEVAEQVRVENESYLAHLQEIGHRYPYRWDDASNKERIAEIERLATAHEQKLAEIKDRLKARAVTLK